MDKRRPTSTPAGDAVKRLQRELGYEDKDLGRALGVARKVLNNKLKGWQKLTPEEVDALLASMGLPPAAALDVSLFFGSWVQAAQRPAEPLDPEQEDLRRCEQAAGLFGLHVAKAVLPAMVRELRAKRIARDRRRAAQRGPLLLRLETAQERRERIEDAEDYQTWALVEWLAQASVRAAADKPARAVELAELALFLVPLVPGPEHRRKRLEGFATIHLANALRVLNDLDAADAAVERAWAAWKAGAADDFLPFEEARLLDLEASLRRAQRRFDEALALLEEALASCPAKFKGRLLLNKAATLEQKGDVEAAIAVLWEARPHVESSQHPRDLAVLLFNLTVNLEHLGRFTEAEDLLPAVRDAAVALGNELDLCRTLWLQAKIDAGLGKLEKATTALEQVFRDLVDLPYDLALAGLNLAALYLEQGRAREVLPLALQIKDIFRAKKVDREAMAALMVFAEAARRNEATADLARQTAGAIEKLQTDRSLPPLLSKDAERGEGEAEA
jgi:tetratricopeptide (TPR) repeat protein/DNA-binding XRE family transcriptional regulator